MRVETRPAVVELVDTIARELWAKELQGELPDGTTARWTSLLDETLLALPSDHGLHPRLHEEEDPTGAATALSAWGNGGSSSERPRTRLSWWTWSTFAPSCGRSSIAASLRCGQQSSKIWE